MAKYSNTVSYDIKTTLDASGITKLRSELSKLNQDVATIGKSQWGLKDNEIQRTIAQVNKLQTAITECFNPKIGMLDLSKFNKTLEQEKALLGTINTDWARMGTQGTRAINSLAASVLTLNKDAITVNSTLSKIANTFSNTVRWGITASIFQEMMSSIQGAVSYMKDLDESLTNIQMVTNSSKEDMRELAQYANNAAQALGSTTTDYTNAVKVFVQEGFSESESKQYANLSTKLANVSEQSTDVTSDQITAYRNAFQLDYQQTVEAMDKVANVANNTASNVNELMTASQRAASVAQAVGTSQDSFLAAIATIESVTRQSAEEIGNGLKTIYQRFADIKVSGSTDDGVDYGQYAKALQSVGVDVLDVAGQFKGMDQILAELQNVWSTLDDTMKIAVGEKVAGKFQYNRFAALMNNQEYYQKALNATQGANGMMDQMNDYYIEGIEGRLNTLQTAGEQIMSTLFDQDNIEPIIGAATDFLNVINKIIDAVGGGLPVFTALSGILLRTFNTQIGEQVARIATNIQASAQISRNANFVEPVLGQIQGLQEARGEDTSAIGEIRNTLQGKGFSNLTEDTRNKVKDSALELLEAENKVADVKNRQQLLQQQINKDLANNSELADVILAEDKEQYELGAKRLQQERDKFDAEVAFGDLSEEEIQYRENELRIAEEAVEADRIRYEQTQAKVNLGEQLNNYTLEELVALDKRNTELGQSTDYAERYLEYTEAASVAEGELNAASEKMKGVGEQVSMERQAASITNLVSGLTSAVFLTQSLVSLWQLWGDENTSQEDKIIGTVSSLVMILPMAITAWQAFAAVEWEAVKASLAFVATPVGAAIAAVVAAIGIAVVAFNSWQESIHAASKEFEAQKELLSKTKKNYSDARDEVDALKESIDSLGETKTSLADLTKGTDEWREAVRKLNDQVLALLQTYPELAQYVTNEDGVLNISDVGMDQFYQQQLDEANHLAGVNSVQQINTLQAQNDKYVEDFSNQWGLSKQEISDAISQGTSSLEGKSDLLNSAFAELKNKMEVNSLSIDNLSNSVGTLNATYESYASNETVDTPETKEAIRRQYGTEEFDSEGNATGTYKVDFSTMTNNQEFLDAIAKATGEKIIGASDSSWFDDTVKFKTSDGDEFDYTSDQLVNLLADSQAEIDATNKKLEENRTIYEAFGASYNAQTKSFVDASGNTITSLEDLGNITGDQIAAIQAFQEGIYNDIAVDKFNGSLEDFVTELQSGRINVKDFSDALVAAHVQQNEQRTSEKLEGALQTDGVMVELNGKMVNKTLNPEEAKKVVSEVMKQLNESNLSDDEKLQLMDKINWDMPVQDIIANIKRAIDTGNVEAAFINTANLEDDSARKSQISEEYDISEATLNAYTEQLQTTGALAQQHDKLANSLEEAKEKFGEESEEAKNARNALAAFEGESEDIAVDLAQTQKGLESLSDNMAKYEDILKNGDKTTLEYAEALGAMKQSLADTLNVSEESISNSLIESHLGDIQALAEGDEEALNNLRAAAGQDIVAGFYMAEDSNLTEEHMEYLRQQALAINSLDLEVGADINDEQFRNTLNEMLANGELTKDQVNEYLRGIGVEPHFESETVPSEIFTTRGMSVKIPTPWGEPWNIDIPEFSLWGQVAVPQIVPEGEKGKKGGKSGGASSGTGLKRTTSPTAPSGQSGISKNYVNDAYDPEKQKKKNSKDKKDAKKEDKIRNEWDYLTDITNDLERQSYIVEKLSKLEDRLYGKDRISQIQKLQKEYKTNIKLLQQEQKLAERHAKRLRTKATDENGNPTINAYAAQAGFKKISFDSKGNLEQGKAIENALTKRVNDAVDDYNKHRNDDNASYYSDKVKNEKAIHDGFLKAMSEYQSTLGKIEDTDLEIQKNKEALQDEADKIVDAIQDGLDGVTKAIEDRRDFNKMIREWREGGSDYTHFNSDRKYANEYLNGVFRYNSNLGNSVVNAEIDNVRSRIADAKKVIDKNPKNADDEKLSQEQAYENLSQATDGLKDTLSKMIENYESLLKTIEEASSKMDELIDDRLGAFDEITDTLDSEMDQLKLVLGNRSLDRQEEIYSKKITVNMEKMNSIATAINQKQITVKNLESLEASGKELSSQERQALKDARSEITSLQQEQIDTETQIFQDIAERLRTQTTKEMTNLTNSFFGQGADVDWMAQQWEVKTRNDNQYLDDYNRAYEIQKLQLKYQNLLNDSQNSSALIQKRIVDSMNEELIYLRDKQKLKINEKGIAESINAITEYDVKYAEAQLNILQKQIALEDARDAKSQMRLQRNAAGNYDFVYAADEDAVNKATEALLQAQQDAYNLSKQTYLETYQAAYEAAIKTRDMAVEIAMDTSISVEERAKRIQEIMNSLGEYIDNSRAELVIAGVDIYNSLVDAENMIAQENEGHLAVIFDEMALRSSNTAAAIREASGSTKDAVSADWEEARNKGIESNNILQQSSTDTSDHIATKAQEMSDSISEMLIGADGKIIDTTRITDESVTNSLTKIDKNAGIYSASIQGQVLNAIGNIDKRFDLSKDNFIERTKNIQSNVKNAFDEITKALKQYQRDNTSALNIAGKDWSNFGKKSISEADSKLKKLIANTNKWNGDLTSLNGVIQTSAGDVANWKEKIDDAVGKSKSLINASHSLQEKIKAVGSKAASSADKMGKLKDKTDNANIAATHATKAFAGMNSVISNGYSNIEDAADKAKEAAKNTTAAYKQMKKAANEAAEAIRNMPDPPTNNNSTKTTKNKTYSVSDEGFHNIWYIGDSYSGYGYATGGYTGSWSDHGVDDKNGKWAILHQKELVLNAHDTENMLSAVELVRDIMSGINNSIPSIGKSITKQGINDTINQRVAINATFPGVTEVEDIKQALIGLADNAYQYANKYQY